MPRSSLGGGGGTAAWGIFDVVGWIFALHRGEGVIETDSFILGLPLIGVGLSATGAEFIAPRVMAAWSDRLTTRMSGAVLGSILAGILLVLLGHFVITLTIELEVYHACDVDGRGRVTVVTGARADIACRATDVDL